jgi:hypothetical protein
MHRPTDDFRANLEWEVLRRYRRNVRANAVRPVSRGFAKVAAIVVVSVSIGLTAGFASAQIARGGGKDSLLADAQASAMLAKTRLDIAKAEADDVLAKARVGANDQQAVLAAMADVRDMEARLAALKLNIDEITASGQAPRDDLGAPLVGGRDYVKQRIALEASVVQAKLKAFEETQANAERRFRVGAEDQEVVTSTRLKVIHVQGQLSVLAEQLRLRDEFLSRGTPPAQLVQRVESAQLRADALFSQAELTAAKARLANMEKLRAAGKANDVDLLRAQLSVKELELELQRLATRMRMAK